MQVGCAEGTSRQPRAPTAATRLQPIEWRSSLLP